MEFKDGYLQGKKIVIKGDEFMKRLVLIFVLFFMATAPLYAQTPTADCRGSLKAYANDTQLNCRWNGSSSVVCGQGNSKYICRCGGSNQAPPV